MHMDHIWHELSKQIDLYTLYFGQPRFKHVAEFAKFLFLIPHSNSYCEGIFNTVRKICNYGCHNLRPKDASLHNTSCKVTRHASILMHLQKQYL